MKPVSVFRIVHSASMAVMVLAFTTAASSQSSFAGPAGAGTQPSAPGIARETLFGHAPGFKIRNGIATANPDSVERLKASESLSARSIDPGASTLNPDLTGKYGNLSKTASAASSDNGWHFSFAPYLYLTGVSGTVGARGRTLEIDASFGDVLDNLDLPLMGTFEARKGRFVSTTDLMWIKLSNKRDTPGDLYSTAKIGINLFVLDPEVGYRLIAREHGSVDVLGGARIWSVENNLNAESGKLQGFDVSQRKSWAAPVVGVRGTWDLTPKFFVSSKFDIGGAGIGADLTTQFYAGGGYRITRRIALVGGYRYLQADYDDGTGFLFDTRMNGILLGAKFSF